MSNKLLLSWEHNQKCRINKNDTVSFCSCLSGKLETLVDILHVVAQLKAYFTREDIFLRVLDEKINLDPLERSVCVFVLDHDGNRSRGFIVAFSPPLDDSYYCRAECFNYQLVIVIIDHTLLNMHTLDLKHNGALKPPTETQDN